MTMVEMGTFELNEYKWNVSREWDNRKGYMYRRKITVDGNFLDVPLTRSKSGSEVHWYNELGVKFVTKVNSDLTYMDQQLGHQELKDYINNLIDVEKKAGLFDGEAKPIMNYLHTDFPILRRRKLVADAVLHGILDPGSAKPALEKISLRFFADLEKELALKNYNGYGNGNGKAHGLEVPL